MDCDKQKVYELMIGELPFEENQSLLEHLKVCNKCSERAQIMGILENYPLVPRISGNNRWLLVAAAALIILLIPLSRPIWKQEPNSLQSLEQLATRELFPYFPLEVRAVDGQAKQAAFLAYREKRLEKAETLFNQIPQLDPEIYFFRGVTRYLLEKNELALADLEKSSNYPQWQQASSWYLANLYLRTGRRSKALKELERIKTQSGHFSSDARRLIETINNISGY